MGNKKDFFKIFFEVSGADRKLDLKEDLISILNNSNTRYELLSLPKKIADIPTIILSNHLVRPVFYRKSLFTTHESILTTAIIAKSLGKLSNRPLTSAVKNDLKTNIFFLSVKLRKIQLAAIDKYGLIGISKNYPFGNREKWVNAVLSGKNIIAYPEGVTSTQMKKAKTGLKSILDQLNSKNIDYQILPVGIWANGRAFQLKMAKPLEKSKNTSNLEKQSILTIATILPENLRGYYREEVKRYIKTQEKARQQLVDDQRWSPVEPQPSLT